MSSQKTVVQQGGIGLFGILGLMFVGLKLADVGVVAGWSWWWVTSPFWLPLAIVLSIVIVIYLAIAVIGALMQAYRNYQERRRV